MKDICTKIGILFGAIGILTATLVFFPLRQYIKNSVKDSLEGAALDVVQKEPGFLDEANIHRIWASGRYWEDIASIMKISENRSVQNIYFIETTRKPWTILWELGYNEEDFPPDLPYHNYLYAYTGDIPADLYIKNALNAIPDAEILDDAQGRKYKLRDDNIGEIVRELSRINESMIVCK